jgi:Cu-Zn family superoxide dismutase
MKTLLYLIALPVFLAGQGFCQSQEHMHGTSSSGQQNMMQRAVCVLYPTAGSNVSGTVVFTKSGTGVRVVADLQGLTPGKHGFHIHDFGDCSASDAASAGGHYNPESHMHGAPGETMRHAGDMGNIVADAGGKAHLDYVDPVMTLEGEHSIIGHSVIVHEKEDDLKSQPTGNAGARVACGVVGIAK